MKRALQHFEDDQLFRYADGELPPKAAGKVRTHLEGCWECRVELSELEQTVGECVRYRKNVLQRHLPSPPAPWMDIHQRFSAMDASAEPVFFLRRLAGFFAAADAKRWATAVVALTAAVVLFLRFRQTPSVEAAELLRKAIVAADARASKPHRIQVRTSKHRLTRVAGTRVSPAASAADRDALNSLQALFDAAKYDWRDPLSAKSYQAWRDQLMDKRDEVSHGPGSYRIQTSTASGELAQASLRLAIQDLRPIAGRFEFRNKEWVEIQEIPGDTPAAFALAPAPKLARPSPLPAPSNPHDGASAVLPPAAATSGDELRILEALHDIGADLGDPVEISRSGANVIVSGVGISPERRRQIGAALASKPNAIVQFSDAAPLKPQPERSRADNSPASDVAQLQNRIADQIGGRASFDQLAAQVLDLSDPLMSRVYALRRLAERFIPEVESQLSPKERQILGRIQSEHLLALRRQTSEMERILKPALANVTGPGAQSIAIPRQSWQSATEDIFQSARQMERIIAVLFGATQGEPSGSALPLQLLSNLSQLRAGLDAYDRLLATDRRDRR